MDGINSDLTIRLQLQVALDLARLWKLLSSRAPSLQFEQDFLLPQVEFSHFSLICLFPDFYYTPNISYSFLIHTLL